MTSNTIDKGVTMSGGSGTLLAGRYRIVKQLGQGGMGSVWLAEDTQLDNKQFAIKMLPSILVSNKRAYAQLKSEALVAMKLVHPNIVQIRAFEENKGNPFLVMDYVDGQTLDDYLADAGNWETGIGKRELDAPQGCGGGTSPSHAQNGRAASPRPPQSGLTESDVIRLLKPIAAALDYAHSKGVVHRDVKPGNVMVAKDGTPYVLDFGISREMQETMTRVTGKLSSGTLLYMSPEQLHGAPPKKEQDIYSFAAMAYECMSGHTPFCRGQIEFQIDNDMPEPLVGRDDPIAPQSIANSIMSGLAKRPEDRPATCAGVLSGDVSTQSSRDAERQRTDSSRVERVDRVDSGEARLSRPQSASAAAGVAPPRASEEDAARARVEAKIKKMRIERLSCDDGFAEQITSLGEMFLRAELYFESRLWGDALRGYTEYANQSEVLERLERENIERNRRDAEERAEAERKKREDEARADAERRRREAAECAEAERRRREAEERANAERRRRKAEAKTAEELRRLGPPYGTVKTIVLPGGVEIRLRWCRPGTFMMGSPETEAGRLPDENLHRVTLSRGFWIGETPVTQKQWRSVMGNNPSSFKGDSLPVERVSWKDCRKFIEKVNKSSQGGVRLPTEAEWEYACRAGTYGSYGGTGVLDEMGWYERKSTFSVGQKKPNAWGLYDMHGNVWEWCNDRYGDYNGSVTDPKGPESGRYRVLRGGSWCNGALLCRSADRCWSNPGSRDNDCGFRLCCDAVPRE